jgi:hypothetical protein
MTLLSGPQLIASPLAPRLMPPTMLKSPVLMSSPQAALGPVPDGRAAKVIADQYHRGAVASQDFRTAVARQVAGREADSTGDRNADRNATQDVAHAFVQM